MSDSPTTEGPAAGRTTRSAPQSAKTPKAGRNLPAAIGVGVGLARLVIASLVIRREAFLVILVAAFFPGFDLGFRLTHRRGQ